LIFGLSTAEIEDFKAAMRKKPSGARARKEAPTRAALLKRKGPGGVKLLSLKSINNVLTVLHKLLALAQEQGVLQHVPRVKLFKTDKPAFDFLSSGSSGQTWTCSAASSTCAGPSGAAWWGCPKVDGNERWISPRRQWRHSRDTATCAAFTCSACRTVARSPLG
jgi:hypothetical protein